MTDVQKQQRKTQLWCKIQVLLYRRQSLCTSSEVKACLRAVPLCLGPGQNGTSTRAKTQHCMHWYLEACACTCSRQVKQRRCSRKMLYSFSIWEMMLNVLLHPKCLKSVLSSQALQNRITQHHAFVLRILQKPFVRSHALASFCSTGIAAVMP